MKTCFILARAMALLILLAAGLHLAGSLACAQDTPILSSEAIIAGCNADDPTDSTDGARVSPEYTPVLHDPNAPFPNDPVSILEGRVMGHNEKYQTRTGLPQEALTDQAPSEVAEEDIPWLHYTHDKTIDVVPDPGYKHLLSKKLLLDGTYEEKVRMEVEWDNGGVGAEEGTSFIDNIWGALPEWAWASEGDRVWVAGRWIFDCGHVGLPSGTSDLQYVGWDTEIHPPRAMVVFRQNHRLSLQYPNFFGDGGTGGERNPSIWLPITGGGTALPVTEADMFLSGFGGAAQDICSVTNLHISKSGDSDYGDCVHKSPMIAIDDRNYVFDVYPPGTDFTPEHKLPNGTWPVIPPVANAALQWTVIDRLQPGSSFIPAHACGKGPDSVDTAACLTVDPILCLVDADTKAPDQTETGCPEIHGPPNRLRVILPFLNSGANVFAQSILLGWDDVPTPQVANQTYEVAVHKFTVEQNGESFLHDGDWRVYVDIAGQWRYLSNPEFFDKNQNGDNVCHGDSLLDNGDSNPDCFQFDNHPWFISAPAGLPLHVAVGGYESDSVDGWLCWEKDNFFNGGDCNFSSLGGAALAFENDDRIGTLEFNLDPGTGYQQVVPGSVTYDVSVNNLTFDTTKLDDACRHVANLTGGNAGDCSQDGLRFRVELAVTPVLSPESPVSGNLNVGTPSFTNTSTNTTFVSTSTPLTVSTSYFRNVGFQYRFVPDGGKPPSFFFGLPFPFYWTWTDFVVGPRANVPINGGNAGLGGDGGYTVQYSAVANDCDNLFTCAVTEPRHSVHLVYDTTPPVITIVEPTATQYPHSASLLINFAVNDGTGSGVKSATAKMDGSTTLGDGTPVTNGLTIKLLTQMTLGMHTFSVDALDNLNNASSQSVTFEVVVTADSIKDDVQQFLQSGDIKNNGIANSLLAKLNAAANARARGQCSTAANLYQAFINELQAQRGKGVSAAAAAIMIADAQYLIAHCP